MNGALPPIRYTSGLQTFWSGTPISVRMITLFFFPVPVCAITASGVPGGTSVSMNRFSTLCG
jgi:hypothetical protein